MARESLLARWRSTLARWFRREPVPGRWIEGGAFAWQGWIGFRPLAWPRRRFRLYRPRGHSRLKRAPLIVLIHGCKQTPDEFARGTRITALADRVGALVLMPDQSDSANPYRCWNWFDTRTAAGRGEAAIVAKMIAKATRRFRVDADRVLVAGISAGAALATILGLHHRDVVRAVFTQAGLACGAASSAFTALSVMARGPDTDIARIAREASALPPATALPICVVHGLDDDVVAPRNALAIVRQYLVANGIDVPAGAATTLPDAHDDTSAPSAPPFTVRIREWRRDARPLVRLVEIGHLGHAWPGGDDTLPFNEPAAPDGTALLGDWLAATKR